MKNYTHILITIDNSKFEQLNNLEFIQDFLEGIVDFYKLNVLRKVSNTFLPQGLTCFYLLQESHISVHTCPELGRLYLDIFAQIDNYDPEKLKLFLEKKITGKFTMMTVLRDKIHENV